MNNYREELTINEKDIKGELLKQASLFGYYSDQSAKAQKESSWAEQLYKQAKAKITLDVNENPGKYGLEKVTVALLDSAVRVNEECIKAKEEMINKAYEAEMLKNAVFALHQKMKCLEALIKIIGCEYQRNKMSGDYEA
jgi:phosphopantothenate synthetase